MTLRPTIVKLEPGRELRWLGHLGVRGLFDGEHGFRVVPEDVGRCRFEQFETFTGLLVAPDHVDGRRRRRARASRP